MGKEVKETKEEVVETTESDVSVKPVELTEEQQLEIREEREAKAREKMAKLPLLLRFAMLKAEVRKIGLEKDEAGYKAQYFYVPLQDMQKVFTTLELKYLLTSIYSEETRIVDYQEMALSKSEVGEIRNFAVRKLYDVLTGHFITSTEIDITNLKQIKDVYKIGDQVLRIAEPKDAWKTLFLDFFEPQNLGSISTYFQRYTYNQLYDFQETKEDKIESKGKLEGKVVLEKKEKKTSKEETKEVKETKEIKTAEDPKNTRISDEASKIRAKIKREFLRENIVEQLNGRKLAEMLTIEVAEEFYKEMKENHKQKESEGE